MSNKTHIEIEKSFINKVTVIVNIPSHWKGSNAFFKIYNEKEAICVFGSENLAVNSIGQIPISCVFNANVEEITETMFNEVYEKVINKLNSL